MPHLPSYLHPPFWECKCGIYHLCHMSNHQYIHICDIFARSKFVQTIFCPVFDFFKGKRVSKGVNPPHGS